MYRVTVYDAAMDLPVASQDFRFGQWSEIGFWLDNYGYNDSRFRVKITFLEVNQ